MTARRTRMPRWAGWFLAMLVLYGFLTGCAAISVDRMLYIPKYGSHRRPTDAVQLKTPAGVELSATYLANPDAKLTLWYFHGNAEDLGDIEPRLRKLRDLGYSVFAVDYPGYGLSAGRPSEAGIYAATQTGLAYLQNSHGVSASRIVAYGRSMGSGPAVDLAANQPVAGLIVETGFMSVYRVMTHWGFLPFDQFENLRKMKDVKCPVLLIHGKHDRTIPFYHGEALFAATNSRKEHLWVEGAEHNDVEQTAGAAYWTALRTFASGLKPVDSR